MAQALGHLILPPLLEMVEAGILLANFARTVNKTELKAMRLVAEASASFMATVPTNRQNDGDNKRHNAGRVTQACVQSAHGGIRALKRHARITEKTVNCKACECPAQGHATK